MTRSERAGTTGSDAERVQDVLHAGVDFGRGFWLCRFFRFCCVFHELVNACRVRLGGFERLGVLEGFRQCFVCLFDARLGAVHTAIERVVRLGG